MQDGRSHWPVGRLLLVKCYGFSMQFSNLLKSELSLMSTFYTYEEVAAAKSLLFDLTKSMKVDYLSAFTERKGANKLRATIDDLLGLFRLLDINKLELPCYVVLDIRRVRAVDSKVHVDLSVWLHGLQWRMNCVSKYPP